MSAAISDVVQRTFETRRQFENRARKRGATHTMLEWDCLRAFCNGCVRCLDRFIYVPSIDNWAKPDRSKPVTAWERLTKDHVQPISRGGTDLIENIQPLCSRCNSKKHVATKDYRPPGWSIALLEVKPDVAPTGDERAYHAAYLLKCDDEPECLTEIWAEPANDSDGDWM